MRPTTDKLYYEVFAVGEKLYCLWDHNIPALNRDFLTGVDHEYFEYLADIHSKELAGPNKQRAAVALHSAYFHGLETLFSLVFAGLQAPRVIPAWILKCRTEQLRTLVKAVNANGPLNKTQIGLKDYSWKSIANFYNGVALAGNKEQDKAASDLGELWQMFGNDFSDEQFSLAHNSFKHGFRIKMGGVKVSFAPANTSNTVPAAHQYQELGSSKYGTSFHELVEINGAPNISPERHFRVKDHHVNCYPEYAVQSLRLISISIFNVVSCLKRLYHGILVAGRSPSDNDFLTELCRKRDGINNLTSDMEIREMEITRFDENELNKIFAAKRISVTITFPGDGVSE